MHPNKYLIKADAELRKWREELVVGGRSCWDRSRDISSMSLASQVIATCCEGGGNFEEIKGFGWQELWSSERSCCAASPVLLAYPALMRGRTGSEWGERVRRRASRRWSDWTICVSEKSLGRNRKRWQSSCWSAMQSSSCSNTVWSTADELYVCEDVRNCWL